MAPSRPLFLYIRIFHTVDSKQMFHLNVADVRIRTTDLWCQIKLLDYCMLPTYLCLVLSEMFYSIGPTPPHPTPPSLKLLLRAKKRKTLSFLISTLTVPTNLPTYLPKGRQLVSRKKDLRTRRRVLCVD